VKVGAESVRPGRLERENQLSAKRTAGLELGMQKTALKRWNEGLLQPWERPTLAWLASRLPRWVTPDLLTVVGVVGAFVTAFAYAFSGSHPALLWIATLGLAFNWFGDSLDGTLARLRKIERPRYGYYLDNAIDCFLVLPVAVGLGFSDYVRFDVCFLAAAIYTMISALTFLRANVTDVFQISYSGFGPTEMRVATALLNALMFFHRPSAFDLVGVTVKYPDLIALAWCVTAIISFLACMTMQVRELAIAEPARHGEVPIREKVERALSGQPTVSEGATALAAGQGGGGDGV
jgi:archaetidylinositol phosphate synthase